MAFVAFVLSMLYIVPALTNEFSADGDNCTEHEDCAELNVSLCDVLAGMKQQCVVSCGVCVPIHELLTEKVNTSTVVPTSEMSSTASVSHTVSHDVPPNTQASTGVTVSRDSMGGNTSHVTHGTTDSLSTSATLSQCDQNDDEVMCTGILTIHCELFSSLPIICPHRCGQCNTSTSTSTSMRVASTISPSDRTQYETSTSTSTSFSNCNENTDPVSCNGLSKVHCTFFPEVTTTCPWLCGSCDTETLEPTSSPFEVTSDIISSAGSVSEGRSTPSSSIYPKESILLYFDVDCIDVSLTDVIAQFKRYLVSLEIDSTNDAAISVLCSKLTVILSFKQDGATSKVRDFVKAGKINITQGTKVWNATLSTVDRSFDEEVRNMGTQLAGDDSNVPASGSKKGRVSTWIWGLIGGAVFVVMVAAVTVRSIAGKAAAPLQHGKKTFIHADMSSDYGGDDCYGATGLELCPTDSTTGYSLGTSNVPLNYCTIRTKDGTPQAVSNAMSLAAKHEAPSWDTSDWLLNRLQQRTSTLDEYSVTRGIAANGDAIAETPELIAIQRTVDHSVSTSREHC